MTNAEMFELIFGEKPDLDCCPIECDNIGKSFRFSKCVNSCEKYKWWHKEYKGDLSGS